MSYLTPSKRITAIIVGLLFVPFAIVNLVIVTKLNKAIIKPEKKKSINAISFNVNPPKPPKKKKTKPKKRKPRKANKATRPVTPPPDLGVSFSGVDFGLPEFNFSQAGDLSDSLIGDVGDMVMTEDTVDEKPVPKVRTPIQYPARARSNNVEGRVVVNILVGRDGSAKMLKVVESEPAGVFDSAALNSVRNWRFSPAKYKNRPVEVWVMLPLEFNLN